MRKNLIGLFLASFSLVFFDIRADIEQQYIDFDTRLQFYVDVKTKRFLQKMSIKEMFLLQMIDNIAREVNARGKKNIVQEDVGFNLIFGQSDKLLNEYSLEIEAILDIVNQLEKLETVIKRSDDLKLLDELDQLKDNLSNMLNDRKLTHGYLTKKQAADMIEEYTKEVNDLLKLYEDIEIFEKKAEVVGDREIIKRLQEQKRRIFRALELSRAAAPGEDNAVEEYINEAANLVNILKELDKLEVQAKDDTLLMNNDFENARVTLISNIDERILKLFGYTSENRPEKPMVSDYYKEWKAKRVGEFQTRLTQYRILKNQLIKSAKSFERDRMLENELNDALLNYSDENYDLAIMQFNEIFRIYSPYYEKLDGVIFYNGEANYESGYFDAAFEGYNRIIKEFPQSQFLSKAYLRLMSICNTYNWYEKFFEYYNQFLKCSNIQSDDFYEANYIAGYNYFELKKHFDARKALETIQDGSDYFLASQYLLGVVYINLDNYTKARKIFEDIVNKENFPWTDIDATIIRNEALLKLGYLHFQRAEYDKAFAYFESVSKGYDHYDSSLMGQAWVKMKKGQYNQSIDKISVLTNNYLLSNYTYEAMVLSAHCKKVQNLKDEALNDLRYVSSSKEALGKATDYNDERKRIMKQMDELNNLEEQIIERQDRKLYPKVVKIRETINNALMSFYYRGSISSRVLDEFNDERKVILKQIEEFENIMTFAKEQNNKQLQEEASRQRNRLLLALETYQSNSGVSNANYFIDFPLAIKEGSSVYRSDILEKTVNDLIIEKQRVKADLDMITKLISASDAETQMEVMLDLEILEEDMVDLHNQLNRFQVWLANNQIVEIESNAEHWADFSGFGISDINYTTYYEQIQKMNTLNKNISYIEEILQQKKDLLERKIAKFDSEAKKIQKEMDAEKIRLEKLEKEKYFRDIYFDTKTREIEREEEQVENIFE